VVHRDDFGQFQMDTAHPAPPPGVGRRLTGALAGNPGVSRGRRRGGQTAPAEAWWAGTDLAAALRSSERWCVRFNAGQSAVIADVRTQRCRPIRGCASGRNVPERSVDDLVRQYIPSSYLYPYEALRLAILNRARNPACAPVPSPAPGG
jgi:hypothetical protein